MKALLLLLICVPAVAQKLHVKVLEHSVNGTPFTKFVPGVSYSNGTTQANVNSYGNTATGTATSSGTSIYTPPHTVQVVVGHVDMVLLLPDGRRVAVSCDDHFWGLTQAHQHYCKNPEVDEFEADFSGDKVKLKWGIGIDGKKTESETYRVGKVYPAPAQEAKP
jgi:hypothetical protein